MSGGDNEVVLTDYGFTWGAMEVTCMACFPHPSKSDPGAVTNVLGINAGKTKLSIYVSATGRSVRIFRDGKELK